MTITIEFDEAVLGQLSQADRAGAIITAMHRIGWDEAASTPECYQNRPQSIKADAHWTGQEMTIGTYTVSFP